MEKALLPERSTTAATRVKSRSWCSSVRFDSIADCALRRSTLERTVTSRRRQPRWIRAAAAWLAIGATISREQPWERGPLARIPREPRLAARMRASGPRSCPSPTAARVRFGGGGSDGAERSGPSVAQPLLIFEPVPTVPDARGPLQDLLHGRRRGTLFLRSKIANGLTYKLRHWHAEARGLPVQPSLALVVQVDHCSGHFLNAISLFGQDDIGTVSQLASLGTGQLVEQRCGRGRPRTIVGPRLPQLPMGLRHATTTVNPVWPNCHLVFN